jgi:adenylyltransferase/sulfurtransferase
MNFTDAQIQRYSRHIILPEVGGKGQKKLCRAKVLLIGAGGLGSPAALYLTAAGVGTIGLVDGDVVDLSNLQRQILHTTETLNQPKVESGRKMLTALNPDTTINTYRENVTADNIMGFLPGTTSSWTDRTTSPPGFGQRRASFIKRPSSRQYVRTGG